MSTTRVSLERLKRHPPLMRHLEGKWVRIWSGEWSAWWRYGAAGYTDKVDEAGIFDGNDAVAITRHAGPEKKIEFVPLEPQETSRCEYCEAGRKPWLSGNGFWMHEGGVCCQTPEKNYQCPLCEEVFRKGDTHCCSKEKQG